MPIKCDEYGQVCVLTVTGELTADDAPHVRKLVDERIDHRQIVDFVVDFEHATFVDSQGLETLCWIKKRCDDLFGQFKLATLDESCRKILEITRLAQRFESHGDLAGALKTMR
jgi:anti-sigma B factor antagonist